jgi:hypothetical protein
VPGFRDTLLSSDGRKIEPVETPAGLTHVRTMTAGEKDEFDRQASKDGKFRCRLVLVCCCTPDGHAEFTNLDLPALDAMPVATLEPIVNAAMRINHLMPEDVDELRKK